MVKKTPDKRTNIGKLPSQVFDLKGNNYAPCFQLIGSQSLKIFLKSSTNKTATACLSLGRPISLRVKSKINDN
uniref:hypothetical protein n=1 Tax=Zymomonas mobilis TaxID=542 RepID=UPI0014449D02|nr:hypothetical protein [Zymomonas mobilis]